MAENTPQDTSPETPAPEVKPKKQVGFARMDRTQVAAIAAKGGRAAHEAGTAHEFNSAEARKAGRLGGRAVHAKRKAAADAPTTDGKKTPDEG